MTPKQRVFAGSVFGGMIGVAAVLMGQELRIDGFNADSGFWGTNFLNSGLYGMGNDAAALTVVCFVWFFYGAAVLGGITATIVSLRSKRS